MTNFFAPSSRFGTPDDLKSLIDKAHELGLVVLMDIVHRYWPPVNTLLLNHLTSVKFYCESIQMDFFMDIHHFLK